MRRLLTAVFAFAFSLALEGQNKDKTTIIIKKLEGTIQVDGYSNEPAWQFVKPFDFFVLEPVYGASATEKTELLLTYDSKYLYVAARMYYKDSSTIIARNFVRDGWRGDDWFAFDIDANNDKQNAVRFALYPLGSHFDMAISNDAVELGNSTFNVNYNLIWEGKSVLTAEGWFIEMKIPFAALRFQPKGSETVMNISATRHSFHSNEQQHFPEIPQTITDGARKPSLKQPVVFENIFPLKLLYITPSVSTGVVRMNKWYETDSKYSVISQKQFRPSLDIKYSLSPRLIADITLNTDFAQAEVDDQQFNLTRFSVFFPERRSFFQEQAGLFEFKLGSNSQLFYSRVIGLKQGHVIPLIAGTRLTGKIGKSDIGLLSIQTATTVINDSLKVPSENYSVIRTRHKLWNDRSYIGSMATGVVNRNTNIAVGADAVINVKGQHYFLGALAATYDNPGKIPVLNSSRLLLMWDLRKRDKFFYNLRYNYSGRNFNAAAGFTDRTNFHNTAISLNFAKFSVNKSHLFRYGKITWTNDSYWNAATQKHETFSSSAELSGTTFKGHLIILKLQADREQLADTLFFGNNLYVPGGKYSFGSINGQYHGPEYLTFRISTSLAYGKFYDGARTSFFLNPSWSINQYFELQGSYNLEYLQFKKRNTQSFVHLASLKLAWAFNLHLSGQLQTQYNSSVNKILTNGRMRYHFADGHDLYVVYTQTFFSDRLAGIRRLPSFEHQQFLVKYLYTFH